MASKFKFGAVSEKQEAFFQKQFDKVREDIESLIASDSLGEWEQKWVSQEVHPLNFITTKNYSGRFNYAILEFARMAGGYPTSQWAGIAQVRDCGGRVKKEELQNAHPIFVPQFYKFMEKDASGVERERMKLTGFKTFSVYNIAQCDGVDELNRVKDNENQGYSGDISEAEDVISWTKAEVRFGGGRAAYSPAGDYIMMPQKTDFKTSEAYYSTLFHELTHWTGHDSRCHRFGKGGVASFGSENYSKEELVAEFGAAMLKVRCGIDDGQANAAAYIKSWWSRISEDVSELVFAFSAAGKAVDFIMDKDQFA